MARTLKEDATRYLADVPEERVFRCTDGTVFKNMKQLRDGLANMSEETYTYHVNDEKNDFIRWVGEVLGDRALAAELQATVSRAEAARKVGGRVIRLSRK